MRHYFLAIACSTTIVFAQAQVAVTTDGSAPHASAMLDIKSTNRGFLMPRVANRADVASPATGLQVYETASNAVWVFNGSAWVQLGSGGGTSQWLANGTHIYNGNTGNVGIGINAPTAKLHLAGLMKIDGGQIDIDNNFAQVRLINAGSPKGYFSLSGSSGDIQIGTNVLYNDIGKLQLETKSFPRITILPEGNVGVGTINPSTKLDVAGNIRTSGRVDADGVIEGNGISSLGALYVSGTSLMNGSVTGSNSASFGGNINSNTGMSIKDDAGTLSLQSSGGTEKAYVQLSGENLRMGTYSSNATGKLIMRLNGADHVFVENDGKTGIGQDAPQAKLHINSGASIEALRLTGNTNTIMRFMTGGTEKASIYSAGNHLSVNVAQPGGQVRLGSEVYIDEDLSRVGIGTSLPEERLHVAGNIKTNSGKVLNGDNINMIPVAMAYFDEFGNKVRGTSNISAVRKTANTSFHYFEVTVSGQTDLGNAIISATGLGPQQWASAYGNTGANKATVMIYENITTEETTWKPFYIIIYN
jgi:hypothetical protein